MIYMDILFCSVKAYFGHTLDYYGTMVLFLRWRDNDAEHILRCSLFFVVCFFVGGAAVTKGTMPRGCRRLVLCTSSFDGHFDIIRSN